MNNESWPWVWAGGAARLWPDTHICYGAHWALYQEAQLSDLGWPQRQMGPGNRVYMEAFDSCFLFRDFGESGRGEGWFHWGGTIFQAKTRGVTPGKWTDLRCEKDFPGGASDKEPACQCRGCQRWVLCLGRGRFPGEGNGNSLKHSCLENPMDRGAWWAMVPRVSKSQTQLKRLSPYEMWESSESSGWRQGSRAFCREDQWQHVGSGAHHKMEAIFLMLWHINGFLC